jgi:hypothetical protein
MPFSGISLVARVFRDLGLDLGPEAGLREAEDAEGAGRFARLNDEILETLGGAWDSPPSAEGDWARRRELEPLMRRAERVSGALALAEPWGWADPRNSLTMPFWRELFPDLQVVVCVRHPAEVAGSLEATGTAPFSAGLELWRSYYGAAVEVDDAVVANHARFREDPRAEVERITSAVGLRPTRTQIRRATATLTARAGRDPLRGDTELPPDVRDLYRTLLEAARTARARTADGGAAPSPIGHEATGADLEAALEAQRRELEDLRLELVRRQGYAEALQAQLDVEAASEAELRRVVQSLEQQLVERDEEIATLRENHDRRLHAEDALRRAVAELEEKLAVVEPTRLWRLGTKYWSLKRVVRRTLARGRS